MSRSLGMILAQRHGLPPLASYDRLLCAFYFRAFIADRPAAEREALAAAARPAGTPAATPLPGGVIVAQAVEPAAGAENLDQWLEHLN